MNVQIRVSDELPMNVHDTAGAANDHDFLKHLILEKGYIAICDKAYADYAQYAKSSSGEIFFVTRKKNNAISIVLCERDLSDAYSAIYFTHYESQRIKITPKL